VSLTATKSDSNEGETKTMDIQAKLTGFAMLGATWVTWVLAGLSVGGWSLSIEPFTSFGPAARPAPSKSTRVVLAC
jgi:hypothetical protein